MTQEQWVEVARRINANWPHAVVPDAALAKWYADLEDLSADHVLAAVEALYRDGREFPANGAQIRAKVVEMILDAPDWAGVFRWISRLNRSGIMHPQYGWFEAYQAEGARVLAAMPESVRAFVEALGYRQIWEAMEQEGGGEARLRDKWAAHLRRCQREATYRGLPSAGFAQLERINEGPALLSDVLPQALEAGDR